MVSSNNQAISCKLMIIDVNIYSLYNVVVTNDNQYNYIIIKDKKYIVSVVEMKLFVLAGIDSVNLISNMDNTWVDVCEDYADKCIYKNVCFVVKSDLNRNVDHGTLVFDIKYKYRLFSEMPKVVGLSIYSSVLVNAIWDKHNDKICEFNYKLRLSNQRNEVTISRQSLDSNQENGTVIKIPAVCFTLKIYSIKNETIQHFREYIEKLIEFITIGSRNNVDYICFDLEGGGSIEVDFEPTTSIRTSLNYVEIYRLNDSENHFFKKFSNFINTPRRLFFQRPDIFTERDIPIMTGQFEYLFNSYVSSDDTFLAFKKEKRKNLDLDTLTDVVDEFVKQKQNKKEYDFVVKQLDRFISLKEKIDFVLNNFFKSIGKKQRPLLKGGYSVAEYARRLKDIRNDLCHGGNITSPEDYRYVFSDILLLQTMMYFIVFKYYFQFGDKNIKSLFSSHFFKERFFALWIMDQEA